MAGRSSRGDFQVTTPSELEIVLTRTFDAPARLVWEASTRTDLIPRWYCCMEGFTMPVCESDLRVGGAWRFVTRGPDGTEYPMCGVYREIEEGKRIVQTERYDVAPFNQFEAIVTMTLEEKNGKTILRSHILHATKMARDGHLQSGMEEGAGLAYGRLEEVAQSLRAAA